MRSRLGEIQLCQVSSLCFFVTNFRQETFSPPFPYTHLKGLHLIGSKHNIKNYGGDADCKIKNMKPNKATTNSSDQRKETK